VYTKFQKSRRHIRILGVRSVTQNKFQTEEPRIFTELALQICSPLLSTDKRRHLYSVHILQAHLFTTFSRPIYLRSNLILSSHLRRIRRICIARFFLFKNCYALRIFYVQVWNKHVRINLRSLFFHIIVTLLTCLIKKPVCYDLLI